MAGPSIEWKPKLHPKSLLGSLLNVGMALLPLPSVFILTGLVPDSISWMKMYRLLESNYFSNPMEMHQ